MIKPYHGEIKNLDSSECYQILERGRIAHLACHVQDEIHLVPITYSFVDGYLYSHSKLGKKIEIMRKNPRVCLQVEEIQDFFKWKSIIAWGLFEELKGDTATTAMRSLIKKITEGESGKLRSDLELDLTAMLESAIIYRIKVEKITGRYEWHN